MKQYSVTFRYKGTDNCTVSAHVNASDAFNAIATARAVFGLDVPDWIPEAVAPEPPQE